MTCYHKHFIYSRNNDNTYIQRGVHIMLATKVISNSLYSFLDKQDLVFEEDRIRYSLDYICASITKISVVLIVGAVTGTFLEIVACMLSFGLLRQYSGGSHMGNAKSCLFVMLGIYYITIGLSYFITFSSIATYTVILLSFISVYFYAPADTAKHPIIGPKHRKRLRAKSFIIFILGILLANIFHELAELIIISFAIQAITLTPITYKITKTKRKENYDV